MTANDVFDARSKATAAEAAVDNARSTMRQAQNQLGQLGDINARRKAAEAAVYDAKLNVNYCYVKAPFDGYVTNLNIAVGQYANEGKEVLSLVDNRNWYVIANFRETFLSHPAGNERRGIPAQLSQPAFPAGCKGLDGAFINKTGPPSTASPRSNQRLTGCGCRSAFRCASSWTQRSGRPFRMGQTAVVTIQGYR